jgi:hypothetical protein
MVLREGGYRILHPNKELHLGGVSGDAVGLWVVRKGLHYEWYFMAITVNKPWARV